MYIKKEVKFFKSIFPNIDVFIIFIKDNFSYLNLDSDIIVDKIKDIYDSLINDNIKITFKLKSIIKYKFNFKYKNRLQVGFWEERGHSNPDTIVSKIQEINSKKVKNRFVPTLENLLNIGYTKNDIRSWKSGPMFIKHWVKIGYNEEDARVKLSESQRKSSSHVNYKKRITNNNIRYYINLGFSEDESKKMLSNRQDTINLDKYINKYGVEEGTKIFNDRTSNRSNYLGISKKGYSDISQTLFDDILSKYNCNSDDIFYATKNKEYKITRDNGYWLYDFVDIKNKKIIEFQGDKFHANPNIYNSADNPHPFQKEKKSIDIWNDDRIKKEDAENEEFEVFYVWESDYNNNKLLVVENCLKFLENI